MFPVCELLLERQRLIRAAFVGDAVRFANILPAYVFNAIHTTLPTNSGPLERFAVADTVALPDESDPIWQDAFAVGVIRESVSLFVVVGLSLGRWQVIKDLASATTEARAPIVRSLAALLQEFETPFGLADNDSNRLIPASLGSLATAGADPVSPEILFPISCYLCSWLIRSGFDADAGARVEELLIGKWRDVIQERRFQLKKPAENVPRIEAALASKRSRGAKLAEICLAVEPSVASNVAPDLREFFQSLVHGHPLD